MAKTPVSLKHLVRRQYGINAVRALSSFVIERMKETQLVEVASSMTLTALLSLVPLIAVSLAAFALFPSFENERLALEAWLFESFLPEQYTDVLIGYLRTFSAQASGLGIFGVIGLIVTALLMIDKFFVTVNRIFRVRRMRPWGQRALLYWALITVAPALTAFSLTVGAQAMTSASEGIDPGIVPTVLLMVQLLLQGLAYTFLYKFVPNCHVPASDAAIGGFTVAISGVLVREAFQHYVTLGTLGSIYGAFVALPVLLLWIYISWLLIFAGAAITATIPLLTSGRFADNYKVGNEFLTGVALLKVLYRQKRAGAISVPIDVLSDLTDSDPQTVHRILDKLADKGYCGEINSKTAARDTDWTLLCDPDSKTLRDALETLLIDGSNKLVSPQRFVKSSEEGMLFDWYRELVAEKTIDSPLSKLFQDNGNDLGGLCQEGTTFSSDP